MANDPWARMAAYGTLNPVCGEKNGPHKISSMVFGGHVAFRKCRPIYQTRYPGKCTVCDRLLAAGQGYMERKSNGTWSVFC